MSTSSGDSHDLESPGILFANHIKTTYTNHLVPRWLLLKWSNLRETEYRKMTVITLQGLQTCF